MTENYLEESVHRLPRNLQSSEFSVTNIRRKSIGVRQTPMPFKSSNVSDISESSSPSASSIAMYETFDNSRDVASDRSSETSDDKRKSLSPSKPNMSEENTVAKPAMTLNPSSHNVPTKCFFGGTQRRKRNNPDVLETSFISATNVLKEYLLEKKEEKENYGNQSADEHLAKFIISRLSQLPEENRDEKRKKIIDVLLSK